MKAIICTRYGAPDVLELAEIAKPTPDANEIQVRIRATAVSSGDVRLRAANPFLIRLFFGFFRPKRPVLGFVLSGEITTVGRDVKKFEIGEQVFATTGIKMGAYAEYVCLSEDGIIGIKPENMSHEEAASVPFGGNTALYFLRKGGISGGQKVLIYGASGAIGTVAVQLAVHFGAHVTAVCSGANANLVKSLGADVVIDYLSEDFTKRTDTYDMIFDTVGKSDYGSSVKRVKPSGAYVFAAAGPAQMLRGMWTSMTSRKKVISGVMKETAEDQVFFRELIEAGEFVSIIDRSYPLEKIVEAHAYVDKGHKKGNVVITV